MTRPSTQLGVILLLWALVAVAFAGHNYLAYAANGQPVAITTVVWWSVAEWAPWVVLTPLVLRVARANRPRSGAMLRSFALLATAGVAIAAAQVGLEYLLDRLAVLASNDPGVTIRAWLSDDLRAPAIDLAYLVPRKIGFSYATYWAVVVAGLAVEYHRLFVERDVRAARLEGALLGAQLAALQAQLQPHFLFNTLNAIASLIPEDPAAAEEMVESLGELLRSALRDAGRREIPLERELELVELYLSIQTTRFRGRLRVRRDVDPSLDRALVPPMLLQPLVENAIRHGIVARASGGTLSLRTSAVGRDRLELLVEDDGPGFAVDRDSSTGVGLANVRARLERLYGGDASLDVGDRTDGGAFARVRLPLREAPATLGADDTVVVEESRHERLEVVS